MLSLPFSDPWGIAHKCVCACVCMCCFFFFLNQGTNISITTVERGIVEFAHLFHILFKTYNDKNVSQESI